MQRLEAELKREVTQIQKTTIGKGPKNTSISIFENTILIKMQDVLSTLECSLALIPGGEEKIMDFRKELFNVYSHKLVDLVAQYEECSLQNTLSTINIAKGEVYVLLILDRNLKAS